MHIDVLNELRHIAEEKYRCFSAKLLPPDVPLLGVRIPDLRKYAKELIKTGKAETYLKISPAKLKYQEELILYAMLIGQLKKTSEEKVQLIKNFVPYINSWAVCDIFCADLKEIKKNPLFYYERFLFYTQTAKEYQIRFFYVVALNYFLIPELVPHIFSLLKKQQYSGYYDRMAAAWLLSVAYVKFPHETEEFLLHTSLDNTVLRKSVSKICDSLRVTKENKIRLRKLVANLYK